MGKKGNLVSSGTPLDNFNRISREYFLKAMAGEIFTSREYISSITSNYNITVSAPVFDEKEVWGILFGDINLNQN